MSSIATNRRSILGVAMLTLGAPLFAQDAPAPKATEPFPGVRVDLGAKTVEFDGFVPIDAHNDATPHVYLELMICSPDTREHETLVVTRAKPSHIHAALLMIGLQPGKPGSWDVEDDSMTFVAPEGDEVKMEFVWTTPDGKTRADDPSSWVKNSETGERFPSKPFVFAGSKFVTRGGVEVYDADGAGTIAGLTTFGSELLAWPTVISHEAAVETPVWIADRATTPKAGAEVTVRLSPAKAE